MAAKVSLQFMHGVRLTRILLSDCLSRSTESVCVRSLLEKRSKENLLVVRAAYSAVADGWLVIHVLISLNCLL